MKFTISRAVPESFRTDIIAIGCYERPREEGETKQKPALMKHADGGLALDRALKGEISRQVAIEKFTGEKGTSRLFFTAGRIPARFVLLVGLGSKEKCSPDALRDAGGQLARAAAKSGASTAALVLERGTVAEEAAPSRARAIAEGIVMGAYRFDTYKTSDRARPVELKQTVFLYQGDALPAKAAIETGRMIAEAVCSARDLVNTPGADATPATLANTARKIAEKNRLSCKVLGTQAIRREKMGGLLAIARGSAEPPQFIVLTYRPRTKPRARLALVGKGVTFDAGGISLKTPRGMDLMKTDMAGAAAVLCAMGAIAKLAPPIMVSAFIPAAENLPDGRAVKPGDVITSRSGKTIEIITTDGEGRLLLADAISYAADSKPDAIVDVATLTGGAPYCCGELYAIAMGNDQKLIDRLRRAADSTGEPIWQLPLVEAYRKGYTSGIADLNNEGKSKAQTILGGIFLKEFVGAIPWAHIDIAASSWTDEELPYCPRGATGSMVRTLVSLALNFKKSVSE